MAAHNSTKLVIGNWKMHGSLAGNEALLNALLAGSVNFDPAVKIAVCVPFPYLSQSQALLQASRIAWGSQDLSPENHGAFSGEVSAAMCAEFGVRYALVGHSERRAYHAESNRTVALKARAALAVGITPVMCVGETLEEREDGIMQAVLGTQLDALLELLPPQEAARVVIAYEPVWAIGTGKSASSAQAQEVHAFLRGRLTACAPELREIPLLYGGSVKPGNAAELFAAPDIDGGLIGGAALKDDEFLAICKAANDVLGHA
jgi:triosephosphate isomerase